MKKSVVLSMVGVLFVLGVGISFAYYVSQVLTSGDGSDVSLTPGDMIKVTYDAGDGMINSDGMVPGSVASKDFSVTITPTETEKEATYSIILNITENTFVKCDASNYNELTNACQKDVEELVYRLKDNDNQVIKEDSLIGQTGEIKLITETKTVDTQTTYNYTLEIEFIETEYDQNHNQNKTFNGSVTVEFAEPPASEIILAGKTLATRTDFSTTLTTDTTGTIYYADTSKGRTYYFAGNSIDNWIKFAGFYWRIIRINEDGSIRLIYNGTSNATTGTGTQIGTSAYNSSYNDNAYVGYMYGNTGASSYSSTHANTNNSTIKDVLDSWYQSNLSSYANSIDGNAGFCGNRTPSTSIDSIDNFGGTGTTTTYYGGYVRLYGQSNGVPTFECANNSDLYTTRGSSQGNKALTNPIGLISMDEVWYAGGFGDIANQSYYLYTNQNYWTMSSAWYDYNYGYADVFAVYSSGSLSDWGVGNILGVRPVINLKADIQFISGDGTSSNPYIIS